MRALLTAGCHSTMPIQLFSFENPAKARINSRTDPLSSIARSVVGKRVVEHSKGEIIFSQATTADSLFYIVEGTVILRVVSSWGKEAIVAILGVGDFFGEGCLSGQALRTSTAVAMTNCTTVRLEKQSAIQLIRAEPAVSELFLQHLLSRNTKMQEDLVDQLFNTSEKRLARLLLQLAKFQGDDKPEAIIPKISQETLAEIVGTTRSRVSLFMNKFRRLGLVDYIDRTDVLKVRSTLLNVILNEEPVPSSTVVPIRPRLAAGASGEFTAIRQMSV